MKRLPLLVVILFLNIQGMDNQQQLSLFQEAHQHYLNDSFIPYFTQSSLTKKRDLINTAKGILVACCAQLCLPEDARTQIAHYVMQPLVKKYYHAVLKNNLLVPIIPLDHNDTWTELPHHDGTYDIVPKLPNRCTQWKTTESSILSKRTDKDRYDIKHLSNAGYELISGYQDKKQFILKTPDNGKMQLSSKHEAQHYCFNNDCTSLAFATKKYLTIMDTNDIDNTTSYSLDGPITTLCAAHYSPLFAAGNNKKLILINQQKTNFHNKPIDYAEFSPDDTRLLGYSYDDENMHSQFILWDTSNVDKLRCICDRPVDGIIEKAFFICDGEKIIIKRSNCQFHLLDGLTGDEIFIKKENKKYLHQNHFYRENAIVWGDNNKLIFILETCIQKITILKASSGKMLNLVKLSAQNPTIVGLGMTADENAILLIEKNDTTTYHNKIHQLQLIDNPDIARINFMTKKANLVQLCELWNLRRQSNLLDLIRQYIRLNT